MGDTFGLNWFIPIKQGGFRKFFVKHIINMPLDTNNFTNNSTNNNNEITNEKKNN